LRSVRIGVVFFSNTRSFGNNIHERISKAARNFETILLRSLLEPYAEILLDSLQQTGIRPGRRTADTWVARLWHQPWLPQEDWASLN
jgi:hypothetical protein